MSRARKRPKDAPTFVATIPLRASPTQAREVGSRFECARLLYNACLRVALDRAGATRSDPAWEQTTAMPRLVAGKPNPARAEAFRELRVRHVDPRVHPHLLDEDGARKALPMLQDSGAGRRRAVLNRRVPQALPVGYGVTRRSRSAESPQSAADARKGEAA